MNPKKVMTLLWVLALIVMPVLMLTDDNLSGSVVAAVAAMLGVVALMPRLVMPEWMYRYLRMLMTQLSKEF